MTVLEKTALQEALKILQAMEFWGPTKHAATELQKALDTTSPSLPAPQQNSLDKAVSGGQNPEVLKLYTQQGQVIRWIEAVLNQK